MIASYIIIFKSSLYVNGLTDLYYLGDVRKTNKPANSGKTRLSMDLNHYWHRIREGDEKAFEELFREINLPLCRYAYSLTEDRFTAEEVVQDVFLKIWMSRGRLLIKGSFKSYLFQSVHNRAVNLLVSQKTKKTSVNRLISGESWLYIMDYLDIDEFIIEKLEAKETEVRINQVVEKLPEKCREIFRMSRYEGKTNKQIARHYGISEHTIKTQIYRALERIKKALYG